VDSDGIRRESKWDRIRAHQPKKTEGELVPAVRSYIVRQVREIKVTAMSPTDAVKAAEMPLSMSDEDNRDNNHPVPAEVDISATQEF
jgi:hypothetical protein